MVARTKNKDAHLAWVNEKTNLLKARLPKDVQHTPFYPDANFYTQYYRDPAEGLWFMASAIFTHLKISPNRCTLGFSDGPLPGRSPDMAGFYRKSRNKGVLPEDIRIMSKYKNNPLAAGAILAHEMMHLYLHRLDIKLEDTRENEQLTDLATIHTGLSILVLNGMSYSSQWHQTIIMAAFGMPYWHSRKLAFGYFMPKEYGRHAMAYFKERNISAQDMIGYLTPASRHFIPHPPFTRGKRTTEFIKSLERKRNTSNAMKGAVVILFAAVALYFVNVSIQKSAMTASGWVILYGLAVLIVAVFSIVPRMAVKVIRWVVSRS